MGAHEFSIPASDLDAGGKQVRFPVRAAWIRGALEGTEVAQGGSDGVLDVRLSKSGNDVVVRGRLTAELTVPCARCLEPALIVVNEPVSALAVPASELRPSVAAEKEGEDLPARDPEMIGYDGETLVLDDLVRDELLLAVPMIPLCSEGCPGISPAISSESAQSAVDPRLRPLLQLKKSPM
ncbi:MAG TPA: DUF177 domain-containing protein [Polyangiaceae bacterium]|jgi:uncharacterized protein